MGSPDRLDDNLSVSEGLPIGLFRLPNQTETFAVLPLCDSLNDAKRPFGIIVEDYTQIPCLNMALTKAELRVDKLYPSESYTRSGLIILERNVSDEVSTGLYLGVDKNVGRLSILSQIEPPC